MLGAFVRTHSPWPVGAADGPEHPTETVDEQLPWMRVRAPDIQAAMGVLGRVTPPRNHPVISLSRVDLRSIALRRARLSDSRFRYANLARAVLEEVRLDHRAVLHWPIGVRHSAVAEAISLSDDDRELVEGDAEPVAGGNVGGELVVTAADVLHQSMPGGHDPR